MSQFEGIGGAVWLLVILSLSLAFGIWCFLAWVLGIVLAAFGVHVSFWICFAIWVLISAVGSVFRTQVNKS